MIWLPPDRITVVICRNDITFVDRKSSSIPFIFPNQTKTAEIVEWFGKFGDRQRPRTTPFPLFPIYIGTSIRAQISSHSSFRTIWGDIALAAGFIAYAGPFTAEFRARWASKTWSDVSNVFFFADEIRSQDGAKAWWSWKEFGTWKIPFCLNDWGKG